MERTCTVEGCRRKHLAKEMCAAHYQRYKKGLDLNLPIIEQVSLSERFWSKVDKNGPITKPELRPCWLWTACKDGGGYGRFIIDKQIYGTHNVAYTLEVGPVPVGLELDHLCRVRHCVNPKHLEPVTHQENVVRGDAMKTVVHAGAVRNAKRRAAATCWQGHLFDEKNTHIRENGTRQCRTCHRLRIQKLRAKLTPIVAN